jgi:hypothetical protein
MPKWSTFIETRRPRASASGSAAIWGGPRPRYRQRHRTCVAGAGFGITINCRWPQPAKDALEPYCAAKKAMNEEREAMTPRRGPPSHGRSCRPAHVPPQVHVPSVDNEPLQVGRERDDVSRAGSAQCRSARPLASQRSPAAARRSGRSGAPRPPGGMHPNVLPLAARGCAGPDVRAELDPRPDGGGFGILIVGCLACGVPPGTVRLGRSPARTGRL